MLEPPLERAYRTYVRCHEIIVHATSEPALLKAVCAVLVEELGFRMAWIGMTSPSDERVRPVAHAGDEDGYLERITITRTAGDPHGSGPTGRAVRERATAVARDIATDPRFEPWRADALKRGYASSAAIPLLDADWCLGAISLYAAEPDAFGDDEIALLEKMAADLVLGLRAIEDAHRLSALTERAGQAAKAETTALALSAVAHDLHNSLHAVSLCLDNLRKATTPERREQALAEAAAANAAGINLLKQVTSLTRRTLDDVKVTHADHVLDSIRPLLTRLAAPATLRVRQDALGAQVGIASIDLERILMNLVVNAAHAVSQGGTIEVSIERCRAAPDLSAPAALAPGEYVAFSVADDGAGIPLDVLPHVFDPFFSTKGEAGTGLGLFAVQQLARDAQGDVAVISTRGKGTRFTVYLPILQG